MATDMVGNYLKKKAYGGTATSDLQVIPAQHGVATFVPAGSNIKIINTSGTQVVDTWAFALPNPPGQEEQKDESVEEKPAETPKPTPKKAPKKGKDLDLPSQEDAEKATTQGLPEDAEKESQTKKGWSSYLPSMNKGKPSAQQKENSRTWGQYFSAGQGFTSYIPSRDQITKFSDQHSRDKSKPYIQQLADFSRTPVGAAGISALSGSGYASSLYAGYSAWSSASGPNAPPMEYLSMAHTRVSTGHMVPKLYDILVSNLGEPLLTVLEDSGPGVHDTLIPACDPQRYKNAGAPNWEEHQSCAQNLVMALKEINEKAGLKGPKGIGADVTINSVPAPLNLFMNVPWTDSGDIKLDKPAGGEGDYIRFKAERDLVVVMSACPSDVSPINGNKSTDAHFVVEEENEDDEEATIKARLAQLEKEKEDPKPQRPQPGPRKATPRKLNGTAQAPAAAKSAPKATPSAPTPAAAPKKPAAQSTSAPGVSAAKPAAPAVNRTPTGSTKTKTPVGQTKKAPAAASKPASAAPAKARTPIGSTKTPVGSKKTPIGSTKTPKAPASVASKDDGGLKSVPPQPEASSNASVATDETKSAAPVQKKKPRKIGQSKAATPAASTAG